MASFSRYRQERLRKTKVMSGESVTAEGNADGKFEKSFFLRPEGDPSITWDGLVPLAAKMAFSLANFPKGRLEKSPVLAARRWIWLLPC